MLFRASPGTPADKNSTDVPVLVHGVNLPGHAAIVIYTVTPDKVRIVP